MSTEQNNTTEATEINAEQKHELTDRCFSLCQIFDVVVLGHPAASLVQKEIDAANEKLNELYQKMAAINMEA